MLVLLLACEPATIELDDTGKAGSDPSATSGEPDSEGTGGGDDSETQDSELTGTEPDDSDVTDSSETTETAPDALEGDWSGEALLSIPEWSWEVCSVPMTVSVAGGAFTGEGTCTADFGWGGAYDLPFSLEGEVDDAGDATGTASIAYENWDGSTTTFEGEVGGVVTEDEMALSWTMTLDFGYYGAEGAGSFEGAR